MQLETLALFGGTFNPPHSGHIQTVISAANEFHLALINMLLAPVPPHKEVNYATLEQRAEMLRLACEDYPQCVPDFTELGLPAPHYTVQTLRHLRTQYPNRSIVFIIGGDSLENIHTWREWQSLLNYTHLLVLPRPNTQTPADTSVQQWIKKHTELNKSKMTQLPCGRLFFAETPLWDVSSTQLRNQFALNHIDAQNCELEKLVPAKVVAYIKQHRLYKKSAEKR